MQKLVQETSEFFNRHLYGDLPEPVWSFDWMWNGPIPNYLLAGLYALFSCNAILVIALHFIALELVADVDYVRIAQGESLCQGPA